MAFLIRSRKPGTSPASPLLARLIGAVIHFVLLTVFRVLAGSVVVVGLISLRLSQGPIHLPYIADLAARTFNEKSTRIGVQVGDLVLTLGDRGNPSGLQFLDVRIFNSDGAMLFAVPRLAASFDGADLIAGRLWPTRVAVFRPEARILRTADDHFRFGMGTNSDAQTQQTDGQSPDEPPSEALQFAAVERVIDGFVGDIEPAPELSRLSRIEILDADLTFVSLRAAPGTPGGRICGCSGWPTAPASSSM